MTHRILIVDDEIDMLRLLKRSLEPDLGCRVETASSGEEAFAMIQAQRFDLVLSDMKMPGMGGAELLRQIKELKQGIAVIMMTAYGSIDSAVEAIRAGAYDFIAKPFDHDTLVFRLRKALERNRLISENIRLHKAFREKETFHNIVGSSPAMLKVFEIIRMVARTDMTVLVTGESGTGKELTCRAIHAQSERRNGPFITVNCPTVPEQILESELFGYKKGAFTQASSDRQGLFQAADGGTLFLDEIGEISPAIQSKLLRVIQEKEVKPLGGTKSVPVDVRIIAATNKDLVKAIEEGEFRQDLYYRLNVLPLRLPPLRERREDIPALVSHFIHKHADTMGRDPLPVSDKLMALLMELPLTGNIRELESLVMKGLLFATGEMMEPEDLREVLAAAPAVSPGGAQVPDLTAFSYKEAKEQCLKEFNDAYVGALLDKTSGNVARAARLCGMERQALQQVMKRYGIDPEPYRHK
ncbi:sigma-54-dependent transcriptional regulator [Desulfoluna spongiiphila]|uniref:DNA-binding transcriptional response regulator, NtrC family, contains REC, AAA-type ATPase, and a Fis-type DNA-binding domains n=1 Tax=Desulfoluna spongiiphila TaxID=419481 RepID=A0A1G5JAA6_9BACT|nr:sigma-54 dependent transcriptional regulator [Desulfoluna spongiiphila]SCY85306.1 DNA-binding transcriptional response regulator, NtrC family, contains REC, AAA-type ATPase, and a Fis-type DNA-binding domains [Desulfoluna spongiiphila]VVS94195.1 signal transduction response regulator receiver domain [Desulfoluna spongiiphila]